MFDELQGISESLKGHTEARIPIIFDTPVWNAVTSTGILLTLLEYDEDLYDQVMMIYNRIYILQIAEKSSSKDYTLITQLRSEVIEDIDVLNR